jgi:hypothetical protein
LGACGKEVKLNAWKNLYNYFSLINMKHVRHVEGRSFVEDFLENGIRVVSEDTQKLLQIINKKPQELKPYESIKRIKEMFKWLSEKEGNKSILIFSGQADPIIWNELKEDLINAAEGGTNYIHCLGPVVCVDENGRNGILEAYEKYPSKINLRLFRTRYPYHWMLFTSIENNTPFFKFKGEYYHKPLVPNRKHYFISLENSDDPYFGLKVGHWYRRQQEYESLKPIMDEVTCLDKIPTLSKSRLKAVYEKIEKGRRDPDLLDSGEILALVSKL